MGVSIHYRGRLNDIAQVPTLRDELMDIAKSMNWEWWCLDEDWSCPSDAILVHGEKGAEIKGHLGLKGVQLKPNGQCEPLCFFFDSDGHLRSPMGMVQIQDGSLKPEDAWISVKTQFASVDMHVWIVGLLKYLKGRYMADLKVSDEGDYWGTGNRQILESKMRFLGEKINQLAKAFSSGSFGDMKGLSADEIAAQIERWLQRNLRDEDKPSA